MTSFTEDGQEYIVIPNPIYDVVFRYLLQDLDTARVVLSTLINEDIKKVDFQPLSFAQKTTIPEYNRQVADKVDKQLEKKRRKIIQDNSLSELDKEIALAEVSIKDPVTGQDVKMLHLDFTAIIQNERGEEELVMIELQKAAFETDIFRFKQYICENFQKKRRVTKTDPDTGKTLEMDLPYRLIPIFILNFEIEDEAKDLMVKTRQVKTGIFTGKTLDGRNEFIDNLSYELYVVQLPYLRLAERLDLDPESHEGKLFALLKLFDQRAKHTTNEYRLRLFRRVFPGFLDRVIMRLQSADAANPNLIKQMQAEDHYLKLLLQRDNKISWLLLFKKEAEQKLALAEGRLHEELAASQEKDRMIQEKEKALAEQEQEQEQEKARLLEENQKAQERSRAMALAYARMLKQGGKTAEEIAGLTGLPLEDVEGL